MTPSRPYMVRAINEWLVDNNLTPHVLVDATRPGVQVPSAYVQEGRIVLNVAPGAVRDLFIRNEALSFSARFGGIPMQVHVPMSAVLAIYARENGQGMAFPPAEDMAPPPATFAAPVSSADPSRLVQLVSSEPGDEDSDPHPPGPPPASPTRPALKRVK